MNFNEWFDSYAPTAPETLDDCARDAWKSALRAAVIEWEKPYGLTDGRPFIDRLREMADGRIT